MMARYGASAFDWEHLCALGLEGDLLPVVSDPTAKISPNSNLKSLGKVPSHFNAAGQVVGIPMWTQRISTAGDVARWKLDDRLGICLQTRLVRAIDIDVDDEVKAARVQSAFELELGPLPVRTRSNSGKRLMAVKVRGDLKKIAFDVDGGQVEILGNGQQFVAVGTHPSRVRYEWAEGLLQELPEISLKEFEQAVQVVRELIGLSAPRGTKAGDKGAKSGAAQQASDEPDFDSEATLSEVTEDTLRDLESAIDFLAPLIADDYGLWIKIGQALKSLGRTDFAAEALALWHKFSSASPRYEKRESDQKWTGFTAARTDFRAIFAEAYRHGWQRSSGPAFEDDVTDAGNASLLAWLYPGALRYVVERGAWIFWDSEKWCWDADQSYMQAAVLRVSEAIYDRAKTKRTELQDTTLDASTRTRLEYEIKVLEKRAKACRNRRGIDDCLAVAKRDRRFTIPLSQLDRDPDLLGVANGVVDLRTGELRPDSMEDFVLRRCPVPYRQAAVNPRWAQFIEEISGTLSSEGPTIRPRSHLARYLKQLLGYCVTGLTREQKMFIMVGDGSNGKNVLLDTIQAVLGPYAQSIRPEILMAARWQHDAERPTPLLAGLAGARLAASSESQDGQRLDSSMVKRHTGGGSLTARLLRENAFSFEITHKLLLMTNHRPDVDHLDAAMRGRLHIVPFDVRWNRPGQVDPDRQLPEADKTLFETLKGNLEGVLAWLVEGARDYYENGLEPPAEVLKVTGDYFDDQDLVARFIRDCEKCDPDAGTSARELFVAFGSWLSMLGESVVMSQKAFSRGLKRRGVEGQRKEKGTFYGLRPPAEDGCFA